MDINAPFALATFESDACAPFPGMIVGEHVHALNGLLDGGSIRTVQVSRAPCSTCSTAGRRTGPG